MVDTQPTQKKQKTSSVRPASYRKFDAGSKAIRDGVLASIVKSYATHVENNGGKCKRGFMKSLIDQAEKTVPLLGITRDDVKNEMKRIKKRDSSAKVSPTISDPSPTQAATTGTTALDMLADMACASTSHAEAGLSVGSSCAWPNCCVLRNAPDRCCECD